MFNVNDQVHCDQYGNGIVFAINVPGLWPVYVGFPNGCIEWYTNDGRMYEEEAICLKKIEKSA